MKKLYTLALAATAAIGATAAPGEWTVVEDFENFNGTPTVWKSGQGNPDGTSAIEVIAKDGNADNHAATFNGDFESGMEFDITLPAGTTIADYDGIGLDVYNINLSNYKPLFIYINGAQVANQGDAEPQKGEWAVREYSIEPVSGTENTVKIQVRFHAGKGDGSYAIDNIRLKEKGESGEPVEPIEPGDYNETKNGTVADGWLMVEDYQTATLGAAVTMGGQYGSTSGDGEIIADPKDAKNLAASFTEGDYNTIFKVEVALPEGKTLKDYKTVAFDIYRFSDDDNHKQMYVKAGNYEVEEPGGFVEQAPAEQWTSKEYTIDAEKAAAEGNTFTLLFGIKSNKAHYAVDNVRLQEREESTEPVEPVEYYETKNGQMEGGEYVANDFQHHAATGVELPTWSRYGAPAGVAKTASDPADEKNLVAHFQGGDYNTVHEIDVTLPEGKTLKNYSTIKFNLYRHADDENNKKMRVQADDEELYYDEGEDIFPDQGEAGVWQPRSYDIPKTTAVGNSFKLRAGIESNKANYMIDDVRLVQRKTTGIEDVSAESDMSAAAGAGCITVAGNGTARVYTVDGRMVATLSVAGDAASAAVAPGLYVVALSNGSSVKLMVK